MKKKFALFFIILFPLFVMGQKKPYRILFDITSKDTLTHQAVLRHVSGMAMAYPDALLEVVIYGGAWPMVVSEKSSKTVTVKELAQNKNVSFKLCALTMERHGVKESELISGVSVVPDAIIEIVTRQGEGWGYIKESHN